MFLLLFLIVGGWLVWQRAERHGLTGWVWLLVFLLGTVILRALVLSLPESTFYSGIASAILLVFLYWYIPRRGRTTTPDRQPDDGPNDR